MRMISGLVMDSFYADFTPEKRIELVELAVKRTRKLNESWEKFTLYSVNILMAGFGFLTLNVNEAMDYIRGLKEVEITPYFSRKNGYIYLPLDASSGIYP